MYFEFGQAIQVGLDGAGEIAPGQGAVFGWVRHRRDAAPALRVQGSPGLMLDTILLLTHPRADVEADEEMTVTGFTLVHDTSRAALGRVLVIAPGAGGQEVAIDLLAYDLPSDLAAVTTIRDWGGSFQLLYAAVREPSRFPGLSSEGEAGSLGLFGGWLDQLPRCTGPAEWFSDFRQVAAVRGWDGEVALSGAFAGPDQPGAWSEVMACALVRPAKGPPRILPVGRGSSAPLEAGFAYRGQVPAETDAEVDLVVQLRRGEQVWWFRAEAATAPLPAFLSTLSLSGQELSGGDAAALHRWLRGVLADRLHALRERISSLALSSGAAGGQGGTALFFDLHEDYAARLIALAAPQLEMQFGRVVLAGAAAGRAAAALMGRSRLEVQVGADAEDALAVASLGSPTLTPIDTPTLIDASVSGEMDMLDRGALAADRLPQLAALHAMAGLGGVEGTLRRVTALLAGAEISALPLPAQRPDAIGALISEHLRSLWDMVAAKKVAA
jgi:hypothetical protein